MDLKFRVAARVAKSVHEVFEAVADPDKLSNYFTTGGAKGRLEPGATVTWDFADFPGAFPVQVIEVEPDRKIVLEWKANEGEPPNVEGGEMKAVDYNTRVTMTFTPLDGDTRTMVEIEEKGWRETEGALKASYGNCQGWAQMLAALKAWLEYGINLREGMYK
ncbi:MAG: ATPase [Sphingomonas sp.]|nr:ATPase [Sphingomonas sp.]